MNEESNSGFAIGGFLGDRGPDGFTIHFHAGNLRSSMFLTPDQLRRLWHEAGDTLREFDEMAGEPSSDA